MTSQVEIYVVSNGRSLEASLRFLNHFLPLRAQAAEEYPYPEFSDEPEQVFDSAEALMERLQQEPGEEYGIYWDKIGQGDPHQAMLFYTVDGGLIAGLAVSGSVVELRPVLQEMASIVGGRFGYATCEARPPDTLAEFTDRARRSKTLRLVDGSVFL